MFFLLASSFFLRWMLLSFGGVGRGIGGDWGLGIGGCGCGEEEGIIVDGGVVMGRAR